MSPQPPLDATPKPLNEVEFRVELRQKYHFMTEAFNELLDRVFLTGEIRTRSQSVNTAAIHSIADPLVSNLILDLQRYSRVSP